MSQPLYMIKAKRDLPIFPPALVFTSLFVDGQDDGVTQGGQQSLGFVSVAHFCFQFDAGIGHGVDLGSLISQQSCGFFKVLPADAERFVRFFEIAIGRLEIDIALLKGPARGKCRIKSFFQAGDCLGFKSCFQFNFQHGFLSLEDQLAPIIRPIWVIRQTSCH